ncbi:elongator complex protein 3 [Calderihabitans maritimus]|uniref:Radical SAM protein n=1 Tax=Calderihabitans maritimus TaxID=1246530 RepID=A0A1Z5HNG4_9FIRM|nr:radical SAM protein [Calderihabitans maritimus]GAW91069.1 radical SAM protein [Calderihabitans maritimus]
MAKRFYIIPIFAPHLGCPNRCIFCNQRRTASTYQIPNAGTVRKIIESHLDTIPMQGDIRVEVAFYGGSFTALPEKQREELLTAASSYVEEGLITGIRVSTRPDVVDQGILEQLKKHKVSVIELGVQSMDDEVLAAAGRGHTSRDVIFASRLIKQYGFRLGHHIMLGLPGDSCDKTLETARKVLALKPDLVRIHPTLVIRDTELEKRYRQGIYQPLSLEEAVARCKELVILFERFGVEVIRIGLQPTPTLNLEGDVVAGPFHPALGELVYAAVAYEQLAALTTAYLAGREVERKKIKIYCHPRDLSVVTGQAKRNIIKLRKEFDIGEVEVKPEERLSRGTFGISGGNLFRPEMLLNRQEFVNKYRIKIKSETK